MFRLEISAVSEHCADCIFLFFYFFLTPFDLLQPCWKCYWPPSFSINMEQMGWYENKRIAVCVYAGQFDTPTGVMSMLRVDKGTRKHTQAQKQQADAACDAFCCLLTVYITEPQACFSPASSALRPPAVVDKPLVLHSGSYRAASHTAGHRGRCLCLVPAGSCWKACWSSSIFQNTLSKLHWTLHCNFAFCKTKGKWNPFWKQDS